jgi:hypothetical protein
MTGFEEFLAVRSLAKRCMFEEFKRELLPLAPESLLGQACLVLELWVAKVTNLT